MKAAVLTDYGDVNKLELRDMPDPQPGAGEVKIRVASASINPMDWKVRGGAFRAMMPVQFPYVLGRDAAGEVVEVGSGVTSFKVSDRVLGLVEHGYAQFAIAPVAHWALLPAKLKPEDAAAVPLVALTGTQLIEETIVPKKGDVLLVTGAVGGVGRAAVYAAKLLGAHVIAGVRKDQLELAQKLGAQSVVALDDAAAVDRLPPLDAVADTVGGEASARLVPRVKKGGTWGSVVGEPPGAKEHGITVKGMRAHPDSKRLAALAQAVAQGELVLPIAKRFPLSQVRDAQRLAEGGAGGKVLLVP